MAHADCAPSRRFPLYRLDRLIEAKGLDATAILRAFVEGRGLDADADSGQTPDGQQPGGLLPDGLLPVGLLPAGLLPQEQHGGQPSDQVSDDAASQASEDDGIALGEALLHVLSDIAPTAATATVATVAPTTGREAEKPPLECEAKAKAVDKVKAAITIQAAQVCTPAQHGTATFGLGCGYNLADGVDLDIAKSVSLFPRKYVS